MHTKRIIIAAIIGAVFSLCPCLLEQGWPGEKDPITIVSDRLDAYDDKGLVVFSGNVNVRQEDTVIESDTLHLYYAESTRGENGALPAGTMQHGDIDKIEARGSVRISQGNRLITGDLAVLNNEARTIVITGDVVMKEGENIIEGEKATFFLSENRGLVESSRQRRVKATLYPEKSPSTE